MHATNTARHRRSIRLSPYDYASAGVYFVTICTHGREETLGTTRSNRVVLSELGAIVQACWLGISNHFPRVAVDMFVIMPNHLHGLLVFEKRIRARIESPPVGAQHVAPLHSRGALTICPGVQPGSLAVVLRLFKAAVTTRARKELGISSPIWQRNYYERIVRDGREYAVIQRYIHENPMRWEFDRENRECKSPELILPWEGRP